MSQLPDRTEHPIDTDELVEYLESAPIRIAVFGEFSAGKTTVLNALIGEEILSVAVDPTTAVPTRVRYGREFNIFVERTDGKTLQLYDENPPFWTRFVGRRDTLNTLRRQKASIQDFLREWTREGEKAGEVDRVTIEMPLEWLKEGIELVDTPGVNNEFTRHQSFTEQEAGAADIALLLMDARQGGGKRTEFEFMNFVQSMVNHCLVIPNKMDRLPADEREEFLEYLRDEALPQQWEGPIIPEVIGISALAALHPEQHDEPDLQESFDALTHRLKKVAQEDRGKLLLARRDDPVQKLFGVARALENTGEADRAHRLYFDLLDVLSAAGMDTQPANDGISRCEASLSSKVDELETLNERYNAAIELAETDPDGALEQLKLVERAPIDLTGLDHPLRESIAALKTRLNRRNNARNLLQDGRKNVEQFVQRGDFMEAADEAEGLLEPLEYAELEDQEQKDVRVFVRKTISNTSDWADGEWTVGEGRLEQHVAANEFGRAEEALARLRVLSSYIQGASADESRTEKLAAWEKRVKKLAASASAYEDKVKRALDQAELLQNDSVTLSEGQSLSNAIDAIIPEFETLYGPVDLPEISLEEEDRVLLILDVDEKYSLAKRLDILASRSRAGGCTTLVNQISKRRVRIRKLTDQELRQPHYYKRYPDSPDLRADIDRDLSRPSIFSTRSRIRGADNRINYFINEGLADKDLGTLSVGEQLRTTRERYGVITVLCLIALSILIAIPYSYYESEKSIYESLNEIGYIDQSVALSKLYHSSIFFSSRTAEWMEKNEYPLADLVASGELNEESAYRYFEGNINTLYIESDGFYTYDGLISSLTLSSDQYGTIIRDLVREENLDLFTKYFVDKGERRDRIRVYRYILDSCLAYGNCLKWGEIFDDYDSDLRPVFHLALVDRDLSTDNWLSTVDRFEKESHEMAREYIEQRDYEALEALLSNGMSIDSRNQSEGEMWQPPLIIGAAYHHAFHILDILVEYGADVNIRWSEDPVTPLTAAIGPDNGREKEFTIRRLIELGADPNYRAGSESGVYYLRSTRETIYTKTPLREAAYQNDSASARILLENGAEVDNVAIRIAEELGNTRVANSIRRFSNSLSSEPANSPLPQNDIGLDEDAEIFLVVEDMPWPVGGMAGIQQRINYPDIARRAGVEGRVIVQFVVGENGNVHDPSIVRGIGAGTDEEAIRVIRGTEFTPGRQRGRAVPVRMSWPVTFRLP